eukprot:c30206_g1_i1 orf=354-674(-)
MADSAATLPTDEVPEEEFNEEYQKMLWDQLKGAANEPSTTTAPRRSWDELVGLSGEEAKRKIETENPTLNVFLVPQDSFVTMDFNTGRVRIFVDSNGLVARPPRVG